MQTDDVFNKFLQEQLLILLSFHDEQAKIIRSSVELDLFEGDFRRVASGVYHYIDRYKTTPKDHLEDLFEDVLLNREDDKAVRRAQHLHTFLRSLRDARNSVNIQYVMDRLAQFMRYQEIRKATLAVAEIVGRDREISDEGIEQAEDIITKAMKRKLELFNPGTFLGDDNALAFLDEDDEEVFRTGIQTLDAKRLGPRRGALQLFVGLPKHGKTWYLVNLGKQALKDGRRLLHISLEMSEKQLCKRYHQAIFAIANRRDTEHVRTTLRFARKATDGVEVGDFQGFNRAVIRPKRAFDDGQDILDYLEKRRSKWPKRLSRILIKAFPTGQLTMRQLTSYLDNIESRSGFVPDLMLVDYPQLMYIDPRYQRLELGRIVQGLRGLAVERNMAVAAVSQSSKSGFDTKGKDRFQSYITMKHIAEDFSQAMTADVILTYNQTQIERELGLARIHVAASRDEEGHFTTLISQSYATGQFCYKSIPWNVKTTKMLTEYIKSSEEEESEEE